MQRVMGSLPMVGDVQSLVRFALCVCAQPFGFFVGGHCLVVIREAIHHFGELLVE